LGSGLKSFDRRSKKIARWSSGSALKRSTRSRAIVTLLASPRSDKRRRQSVSRPRRSWSWRTLRAAFFNPSSMLALLVVA
jgi:hypothetical protein